MICIFTIHLSGHSDSARNCKTEALRPVGVGHTFWVALVTTFAFLIGLSTVAHAATNYVPQVVITSTAAVPSTGLTRPGYIVLDACSNIYETDNNGTLYEVPAGGGAAISLVTGTSAGLAIDSAKTNLYVAGGSGTLYRVPITNCVPQTAAKTNVASIGGLGPVSYYYGVAGIAVDPASNLFFGTAYDCCAPAFELLEQTNSGKAVALLTNLTAAATSIAFDVNSNLYYVSANVVYKLAFITGGTYSATPVVFGSGYIKPVGINSDSAGNLYIADQGTTTSTIFEIPLENSGTVSAPINALNPADQFVVAAGLNVAQPPTIDPSGNIYYTQGYYSTNSLFKLTLGAANFGSVAVGQTASSKLTFQFNGTTTFASIKTPSGPYSSTGTTCVTGTAYAVPNSCAVTVIYTPTAVARQSSAVALLDSTGKSLATGYLRGIGGGAALSIDPGTVSPLGSGFKTPTGIAVDAAGNTYIADSGNNTVTLIPAGGGVTTSLGSKLSAPTGVAVDAAGNVYIADSGNNQVVEVPVIGGSLSTASQTTVAAGLKSPAGLSTDGAGNLYITDTGDNTVLLLPNHGGTFAAPIKIGANLNAPLSSVVDAIGNLYIADSGNNQIVEIPAGSTQKLVAVGLTGPSSLAVDTSGSLLVVDKGNNRILRIPNEAGNLSSNDEIEAGIGIAAPYGVAIDANGRLYVTDSTNAAVYTIARSQVVLPFGEATMGTTSGVLSASIESAGNQPLTLTTPSYTASGNAGDFSVQTGGCAAGAVLAAGINCEFAASFTPTVLNARSAVFAIVSNAVSATAPQITATGTGLAVVATSAKLALTSPAAGSPFFGQPLTITATVTPASGTVVPTGFVTFSVDGIVTAMPSVSAGVATLKLSNGLSGGTHIVTAAYAGDATFDGSAATSLLITVTKAPTSSTLTVVAPFNNPYSTTIGVPSTKIAACNNPAPGTATPAISFTATVASVGIGIPTGTMQFLSDGVVIGTAPVFPVAGGGFAATFSPATSAIPTLLPAGTTAGEDGVYQTTHNITANYIGDINYITSATAGTPLTVSTPGPTTPTTPATCVGDPKASPATGPPVPINPATFTISASSNNVTSSPGNPGSIVLTLSSIGGWNGVVDFTCAGLPAYSNCQTFRGQPTITASTAAGIVLPTQVVLSIITDVQPLPPTASGLFWLTGGLLGLGLLIARRRLPRTMTGTLLGVLGLVLMVGGSAGGLSGCSSGITTVSTPKGSTAVTVTARGAQFTVPATNPITNQTPDPPMTFTVNLTVQ